MSEELLRRKVRGALLHFLESAEKSNENQKLAALDMAMEEIIAIVNPQRSVEYTWACGHTVEYVFVADPDGVVRINEIALKCGVCR